MRAPSGGQERSDPGTWASSGSGHRLRDSLGCRGTGRFTTGRFRRPVARHRGGAQPSPGEVRRRRRRTVGGQGHAASNPNEEYDVLRRLEEMGLPAVRPAGVVVQPEFDTAILITRVPRVLAVPPAVHDGCRRINPSTALGCWTGWPAYWWSCTGTVCSGVTARWPTRCLPRRPTVAGVAGRRRDLGDRIRR